MNYYLLLINFARAYCLVYSLGSALIVTILLLMPDAKLKTPTAFERVLAVLFIISLITTIFTYDA